MYGSASRRILALATVRSRICGGYSGMCSSLLLVGVLRVDLHVVVGEVAADRPPVAGTVAERHRDTDLRFFHRELRGGLLGVGVPGNDAAFVDHDDVADRHANGGGIQLGSSGTRRLRAP